MTNSAHVSTSVLTNRLRQTAFAVVLVCVPTMIAGQPAQAQTFSVIHSFGAGSDGASPASGLTVDDRGNLYGTAVSGGDDGGGTVFKMLHQGSGWVFDTLYSFNTRLSSNGIAPQAGVVIGADGSLYGTAEIGGVDGPGCESYGCGLVYNLRPPARATASALGLWTETVLYRFTGNPDGAHPEAAIIFDQAGNIYGTTVQGGSSGWGTAYELLPASGGWTGRVLYSFTDGNDGGYLTGSLLFDHAGRLYGLASLGGAYGYGTVFQLSPSGSFWTESTLYAFPGQGQNGENPAGGLIADGLGNLYGGTPYGGSNYGGTAFEMIAEPSGTWRHIVLYSFIHTGTAAPGPACSLTMDTAGNLYGATFGDGAYGYGSIFKLTPSGGGWIYTDLHDFTGGDDGRYPAGSVTFDQAGNLYGTTTGGGTFGYGVVFEITL
ncbi:MAG TPA: choice-of-anchor tandem repeat GloVer-containing protein [Bryocella sp.]|nr:choice-of-anchor tandem repeat GloVer-containing protein [Bryocella sp.]